MINSNSRLLQMMLSLVTIASICSSVPSRSYADSTQVTDESSVRPVCMFSLKDGWSDGGQSGFVEFITHKAGPNDNSGIPQVVERIKEVLAVKASFDVFIAKNEDNAMAAVANGKKILVVDVDFLDNLNKISKTQWAAIQVMAHEVGHHIAGFSNSAHRNELNADYWSGLVLQRLGASRDASTKAILAVGTEMDTRSHPNKYKRSHIIAKGWDDAFHGKVDYSHCDGCK
ncbi:MAG: hypothetical protein KF722_17335 [Nitrospira sp.]|nr:hypothetical protein [Nitrospira sp.]